MFEIRTEDYLKAIFKLQTQDIENVKPHAISEKLGISPAAVSEMLKKLSEKGFISYAPYKGVSLTPKGKSTGRNMVRRHRILELYLHEKLSFGWNTVHQEAEQLEHAASDELINKMEAALGYPKFDPHGDPIPDQEGKVPTLKNAMVLAEGQIGEMYEIVRVSDENGPFLQYLESMTLFLKSVLTIKEKRHFDRSFLIEVNHKEYTLSHFTTSHIWVVKHR